MRWIVALAVAAMSIPAGGWAQEEMPAKCAAPAAPTAEFSPWTIKSDLASAAKADDLAKAEIKPGQAVMAHLHGTKEVAFVVQPEKPGGSVSHGGMIGVRIDTAGTYRLAIGSGAWLDVLKDGKVLDSTAHGPGPACSGIRKVVDFALQPGRYVIQISANADEQLPVLVARRP